MCNRSHINRKKARKHHKSQIQEINTKRHFQVFIKFAQHFEIFKERKATIVARALFCRNLPYLRARELFNTSKKQKVSQLRFNKSGHAWVWTFLGVMTSVGGVQGISP